MYSASGCRANPIYADGPCLIGKDRDAACEAMCGRLFVVIVGGAEALASADSWVVSPAAGDSTRGRSKLTLSPRLFERDSLLIRPDSLV